MEEQLYSFGEWYVKDGREEDFIKAWGDFAVWTVKNQPGAIEAFLLQDTGDSRRFVSFGPWENEESLKDWRGRQEFRDFFAQARELCEKIEPQTFKLVNRLTK